MGADLSKLSTEDLLALKGGDLAKVSTEGLMALRGEPAPETPERTTLQNLGRQVGLTGRAALGGVGLGGLANIAGLPQPENSTERVVQDIAGTMAGTGAIGAGAKALARGAQGITQPILNMLAANPGAQAISSAGAGGGGGLARESGVGPLGQYGASILGSAAAPASFAALAQGGRFAHNLAYPTTGNIGVRAAGDKTQAVIDALRTEQSNVPGVNLTAGQAAVPANSAEFAALQRLVAEKKAPSDYFGPSGIEGQQEAARLAALRNDIAKTPKDLEIASAGRQNISNRNYDLAYKQAINADPELAKLGADPFFKSELPDALEIAKSKGIDPKTDLTRFLHIVKEGLDAKLRRYSDPTQPAISNEIQSATSDVKQRLVDWLATKNPAYDVARIRHAELSKPINQMRLGQDLEQALIAPATEAERASSFGAAVRKSGNTISKGTGKPRIEDLTPRQKATINALQEDFKRNADYKDLATKGAASLQDRIGAPELPPTGFFQPFVSAARGWVNRALGTGHENAVLRAAPTMADPKAMADAMAKELQKPRVKPISQDDLRRAALAAAIYQGNQP